MIAPLRVGSIVLMTAVRGPKNSSDVVPAIVTRVWSHMILAGRAVWTANLLVLHDGPELIWRSSVYVFPTEEDATAVPGMNAWLHPNHPEESRV